MFKILSILLMSILLSCVSYSKLNIKNESVLVLPVNIKKRIFELISLDHSIPVTRIQLNENFNFGNMKVFFTEYGYILGYHPNMYPNVIKVVEIIDKPAARKIVLSEEIQFLKMKDQSSVFIVTKQNRLLLLDLKTEELQVVHDSFLGAISGIDYQNDVVYLNVLQSANSGRKILMFKIKSKKISELAIDSYDFAVNRDATMLAYHDYNNEKIEILNLVSGEKIETNTKITEFVRLYLLNSNFLFYAKALPLPFQFSTLPPSQRTIQYIFYNIESGRQLNIAQIKIDSLYDTIGPFLIRKSDALKLIQTMKFVNDK